MTTRQTRLETDWNIQWMVPEVKEPGRGVQSGPTLPESGQQGRQGARFTPGFQVGLQGQPLWLPGFPFVRASPVRATTRVAPAVGMGQRGIIGAGQGEGLDKADQDYPTLIFLSPGGLILVDSGDLQAVRA